MLVESSMHRRWIERYSRSHCLFAVAATAAAAVVYVDYHYCQCHFLCVFTQIIINNCMCSTFVSSLSLSLDASVVQMEHFFYFSFFVHSTLRFSLFIICLLFSLVRATAQYTHTRTHASHHHQRNSINIRTALLVWSRAIAMHFHTNIILYTRIYIRARAW